MAYQSQAFCNRVDRGDVMQLNCNASGQLQG